MSTEGRGMATAVEVGGMAEAIKANVTPETVHEVAVDQLEPAKAARGERGTAYVILSSETVE